MSTNVCFPPRWLITASHPGIMSMPHTEVHSNYIHSLEVVLVTLIKSNPDPRIFIQILIIIRTALSPTTKPIQNLVQFFSHVIMTQTEVHNQMTINWILMHKSNFQPIIYTCSSCYYSSCFSSLYILQMYNNNKKKNWHYHIVYYYWKYLNML